MNALLVPTSKYHHKESTNKKRIVKTSISDARKSFLNQVALMNDLHTSIQIEIDNAYKEKKNIAAFNLCGWS
jgi:hypothetical protein